MVSALVAVLAAGVTLVMLTSPDPAALEATTSTSTTSTTLPEVVAPIDLENFSVDQVARGEPFAWVRSLNVVEGFPVALLRHESSVYLFATEEPNFSGLDSSGLRAWRSSDGLAWEPLGQVIGQSHRIGMVSSTEQGLTAVETGSGNPSFTVWRSQDGRDWRPEEVALEDANDVMTLFPHAVGGTGRLLIVAGQMNVDIFPFLEEKLGEMAHYGWGTDVFGDEVQFTLYGPFGIPLAGISAEDLSLSDGETQMIIDAFSSQNDVGVDLWVKDGESEWQQTRLPEAHWVDRITTTPYGDAIAHGWGTAGSSSWTSRDGLNWEKTPFATHHYLNERWGETLVAPSSEGGMSIYVSPAGGEWNDIGPAEHFPAPIQWWLGPVAAGPGGIAASVQGWDVGEPVEPVMSTEPPTLSNQDAILTIDVYAGEYRLEKGEQVYRWPAMAGTPDGIDIDLDSASIQFLDPESGRQLASFQIEDIIEAQEAHIAAEDPRSPGYAAFAFTSDGTDWTIQSHDDIGSESSVTQLAVTDSHVVATAVALDAFYNPSSPTSFEVWTAATP